MKKILWIAAILTSGLASCSSSTKNTISEDINHSLLEERVGIEVQVRRYKDLLVGNPALNIPSIDVCEGRSHLDCQIYYTQKLEGNQDDEEVTKHNALACAVRKRIEGLELALQISLSAEDDGVRQLKRGPSIANVLILQQLQVSRKQMEGLQGLIRYHANQGKYVQGESSQGDSVDESQIAAAEVKDESKSEDSSS